MARLDRLAPAKEVAQIGAVHRPGVLATSCWPRSRPGPTAAARGGARPARRRRAGLPARQRARGQLHLQARPGPGRRLRVAPARPRGSSCTRGSPPRWRTDFRASPTREPELLAHHYAQAGLAEQAVEYWSRAGELAIGALGQPGGGQPPEPRSRVPGDAASGPRAGPAGARAAERRRRSPDRDPRLRRPRGRRGVWAGAHPLRGARRDDASVRRAQRRVRAPLRAW